MMGTCQEIHPTNIQLPAGHEVLDVEARVSEEESNIEEGVPVLAIDDSAQDISAILIETFVEEQSNDNWCQKIKVKIDNGLIKRYRHDDRGLLVRASLVDSLVRI